MVDKIIWLSMSTVLFRIRELEFSLSAKTISEFSKFFAVLRTDQYAIFKHPSPHKQCETFQKKFATATLWISLEVGGQLNPKIHSCGTHGQIPGSVQPRFLSGEGLLHILASF